MAEQVRTPEFPSFAEFFEAVHGHTPHTWQQHLAAHLAATGRMPDQVAVPTGLGKTATIDAVVWARSRQRYLGQSPTLGRRLFLIVERQVIADGSTAHVRRLADALTNSPPDHPNNPRSGVLGTVATALIEDRGEHRVPTPPLRLSSFHGSRRDDRSWLDMTGTTVIVTTVTQLTLRLLGRAPGVGAGSAPVHAGLAGMDSVFLVDEPHLASPMVSVLGDVVAIQARYTQAPVPSPQLCVLGATLPPGMSMGGENATELSEPTVLSVIGFDPSTEGQHARTRWAARRPVTVAACETADAKVVGALVAAAEQAVANDEVTDSPSVLVVANTVATARKVHAELVKKTAVGKKNASPLAGFNTPVLVTGRLRGADRADAEGLATQQIIVATQTVEAGVDLSRDILVTELAPWPSLVQRLGRLNRDGSHLNPQAVVVIPSKVKDGVTQFGSTGAAMIYGDGPLEVTARMLLTAHEVAEDGVVDAGLSHQADLVDYLPDGAEVDDLWPNPVTPATLTEAAARMLLSTQARGVEVTPYLTGIFPTPQERATVTVAWRGVLDTGDHHDADAGAEVSDRAQLLETTLAGTTPHTGETVEIPIGEAKALLVAEGATEVSTGLDGVLATTDGQGKLPKGQPAVRPAVRLTQDGTWEPVRSVRSILPGDLVVIDAEAGGYHPDTGVDVTKTAVNHTVPDVSLQGLTEPTIVDWTTLTEAGALGLAGEQLWTPMVEAMTDPEMTAATRRATVTDLLTGVVCPEVGIRLRIRNGVWQVSAAPVQAVADLPATSQQQGAAVGLREHSAAVAAVAADDATAVGVDSDVFTLAGLLHDVGKANDAFQVMIGRTVDDPLLAKSDGRRSVRPKEAGLRPGYLHEMASTNAALEALDDTGLTVPVGYLVASHHGRHRGPHRHRTDVLNLVEITRRMEDIWGPWGLCWWESILRLADQHVSQYGIVASKIHPLPADSTINLDAETLYCRAVAMVTEGAVDDSADKAIIEGVRPGAADTVALTGLGHQTVSDYLASLTVLAAVSAHDGDARISWDHRLVPQLHTVLSRDQVREIITCDIAAALAAVSAQVDEVAGTQGGVNAQHNRLACAAEEVPQISHVGEDGSLARRVAESVAPSHTYRVVASKTGADAGVAMSTCLPHRNSSVLERAGRFPVDAEVVFNADHGFFPGDGAALIGGGSLDVPVGLTPQWSRPGQVLLTALGGLLGIQPGGGSHRVWSRAHGPELVLHVPFSPVPLSGLLVLQSDPMATVLTGTDGGSSARVLRSRWWSMSDQIGYWAPPIMSGEG